MWNLHSAQLDFPYGVNLHTLFTLTWRVGQQKRKGHWALPTDCLSMQGSFYGRTLLAGTVKAFGVSSQTDHSKSIIILKYMFFFKKKRINSLHLINLLIKSWKGYFKVNPPPHISPAPNCASQWWSYGNNGSSEAMILTLYCQQHFHSLTHYTKEKKNCDGLATRKKKKKLYIQFQIYVSFAWLLSFLVT